MRCSLSADELLDKLACNPALPAACLVTVTSKSGAQSLGLDWTGPWDFSSPNTCGIWDQFWNDVCHVSLAGKLSLKPLTQLLFSARARTVHHIHLEIFINQLCIEVGALVSSSDCGHYH